MKKRILALTLCLSLLLGTLLLLGGCAANTAKWTKATGIDEIAHGKFGGVTGGIGIDLLVAKAKNTYGIDVNKDSQFFSYKTTTDVAMELLRGRLDGGLFDEPVARLLCSNYPGLVILDEAVEPDAYGYAFRKDEQSDALRSLFDTYIEQFEKDGTLDLLKRKWLDGTEGEQKLIEQDWDYTYTIRYAHCAVHEPLSYAGSAGEPLGLEPDLILYIARECGFRVEFTSTQFSALLTELQGGRADVVSGSMSITEERQKTVNFSRSHYPEAAMVVVVYDPTSVTTEQVGFFEGMGNSFVKTFVEESRWQLILKGIGLTLLISVAAGVLGLFIGFGLCMLRRMKNNIVSSVTAGFIRIVQGLPIVVLLMLLYYVIFGALIIPAIIVAIIGFGINFGAYTSEMMRTGIDSVDKGQMEAALAMGYTRAQAFRRIILPQAARYFLPVMKGEFISMVKMTSVAGYITIQDLTQISDIIRAQTMEAFFPLIFTAIFYFIIAYALVSLLSLVEKRLEPKRNRKTIKGVTMQ